MGSLDRDILNLKLNPETGVYELFDVQAKWKTIQAKMKRGENYKISFELSEGVFFGGAVQGYIFGNFLTGFLISSLALGVAFYNRHMNKRLENEIKILDEECSDYYL